MLFQFIYMISQEITTIIILIFFFIILILKMRKQSLKKLGNLSKDTQQARNPRKSDSRIYILNHYIILLP